MNFFDHPDWKLVPHSLNRKEIENPHLVLQELFDFAHLPELRCLVWEWLKITVSGSYHRAAANPNEKADLLFLYERLLKLIEASHLIWLQKQQELAARKEQDRHIF